MAIAPSIEKSNKPNRYIAASYCDHERLYLVFGVDLDADLPPLSADLSLVHGHDTVGVAAIDLHISAARSLVVLLLEQAVSPGDKLILRYRPTQWLMCTRDTGESLAAFDEVIYPRAAEALDPSLRLKTKFEPAAKTRPDALTSSAVEVRFASAFQLRLHFADPLDTAIPLDVDDFRAEREDRWLKITAAQYVKSRASAVPQIQLELSAPIEPGSKIVLGYRSPANRLRTLDAAALAPFNVEAVFDEAPHDACLADLDDEHDTQTLAFATEDKAPNLNEFDAVEDCSHEAVERELFDTCLDEQTVLDAPATISEDAVLREFDVLSTQSGSVEPGPADSAPNEGPQPISDGGDDAQAAHKTTESAAKTATDPGLASTYVNSVKDPDRVASIAEKTARLKQALASKTAQPQHSVLLASAVKLIYFVPIVIFVWLVFIVGVYVATIVFDVNLRLPNFAASPTPSGAQGQTLQREQCAMQSDDGSSYQGECLKGERDGFGTYLWPSGNRYEGHWLNGKRHGKGRLMYSSGAVYEGEYRAGHEHGRGKMRWPNGASYEGAYEAGKFHGKGVYTSAGGNRFEGRFERGSMTQAGTCTMKGGEEYAGPCRG